MIKKLNYKSAIKSWKLTAQIQYFEKLPKTIIEIIKISLENNLTIEEYFKKRGLVENSQLLGMAQSIFNNNKEILNFSFEELNTVYTNGKIKRYKIIEGEILTMVPLIDQSIFTLFGKSFNVNINEDFKNIFIKRFKIENELAIDVEVLEVKKGEEKLSDDEILLSIKEEALHYKNSKINIEQIDFQLLFKLNDINPIYSPAIKSIQNGYKFLIGEYKFKEYNNKKYLYEIKDTNIEFYKVKSYYSIPISKHSVIRKNDFQKDSFCYQALLNEFKNNNSMTLNSFIFLEFLKNEEDLVDNLLVQPGKLLEKIFRDEELLRTILLLKRNIKLNFNVDMDFIVRVLEKASIKNIPIIIDKIPETKRNSIKSYKLISRIFSIDKKLLTNDQLEMYENEEKRKRELKNDYINIVGQITTLGIREGIKRLNKKQISKLGGKSVKKWLDKNIGHSSNVKRITKEQVEKAKDILRKYKKLNIN